jgi:TatA/E family protein of Tat protein translocase
MMGLSAVHVLIFAIVAILLFRNRLPSLARSLGRVLVEFKNGMNALESDFGSSVHPYSRYEKRFDRKRIKTIPEESEFNLSPLYWPALRFGILVQVMLGVLTALMLDMGQSFAVFKVAFLGHWLGILLLFARRPISPTKTDIIFIRWGTPLLMMAIGLIAPLVWKSIGKSDLSGWQRLWSGWTRR